MECRQHTQRAARAIARRFDIALKPAGLTSGQFSLLLSLNRPGPASPASVAKLLGMDRSSVTANLKPLERQHLVKTAANRTDGRVRLLQLTTGGGRVLAKAVPIWRCVHAEIEASLSDPDKIRSDLNRLSASD